MENMRKYGHQVFFYILFLWPFHEFWIKLSKNKISTQHNATFPTRNPSMWSKLLLNHASDSYSYPGLCDKLLFISNPTSNTLHPKLDTRISDLRPSFVLDERISSVLLRPSCSVSTSPSRSGASPWIQKRGGLESTGRRLISAFGKTKRIEFFWAIFFFFKIFRLNFFSFLSDFKIFWPFLTIFRFLGIFYGFFFIFYLFILLFCIFFIFFVFLLELFGFFFSF